MTVTDRTAATEQEFRDRIKPFEGAPTPPEVAEAAVLEEVARAMEAACTDDATWLSLAVAAVTAYRATQDGGAEEAVRRVEALAEELQREGEREEAEAKRLGKSVTAESWWGSAAASLDAAHRIRAALAPQAGDGAR